MVVPSHEVSTRTVWAIIRMLERASFSNERLFQGLPFGPDDLKGRKRISWDDYVTICDNLVALVGDMERIDELVEDGYHEVIPELRTLGRVLIEPKPFVRFVLEVLDPIVWPAIHCECEDLGGNDMRVTMRIRPGARPNPAFIRFSVAALRGVTRHLDLPPTKVLRTDLGSDYGVYWARLPASRTLVRRAGRASLEIINRVTAMALFGDGDAVDPLDSRLDEMTVAWSLSRRQIEVLRLLAQGQANKEIAQALGCAENTVELHVTQLLRKAEVPSRARLIARFWRDE